MNIQQSVLTVSYRSSSNDVVRTTLVYLDADNPIRFYFLAEDGNYHPLADLKNVIRTGDGNIKFEQIVESELTPAAPRPSAQF